MMQASYVCDGDVADSMRSLVEATITISTFADQTVRTAINEKIVASEAVLPHQAGRSTRRRRRPRPRPPPPGRPPTTASATMRRP